MTIAVGVLAGNSIILASDSEHAYEGGEIKGTDQKIMAMTVTNGNGDRLVSAGIVGAGYTDYVNAIRGSLTGYLAEAGQDELRISSDDIRIEIEKRLKSFYDAHVIPFYALDPSVEFDLLVAASFDGRKILLASGKTAVRPVIVSECIGFGRSYGTSILNQFKQTGDVSTAVMQACYTVLRVKDTVRDCGRATQILCLMNNGAVYIPDDVIQELEAIMMHYSD